MEKRQPASDPGGQEASVTELLDQLLDGIDPGVLSQRSLDDLRDLRHRYQEVETGLSFGRRLVQGRIARGRVDVTVTLRRTPGAAPTVRTDVALGLAYARGARAPGPASTCTRNACWSGTSSPTRPPGAPASRSATTSSRSTARASRPRRSPTASAIAIPARACPSPSSAAISCARRR